MSKLLSTLSLLLLVAPALAAPTKAAKPTRVAQAGGADHRAQVDACVRLHEQVVSCKEPFIDAMMALRAKYNDRFAAAYNDPAQRAEMRTVGLQEVVDDGTGPLAPRQAACEASVDRAGPVAPADLQAAEACYAKASCEEKVACLQPVLDRMLATARPGR